MQFRQLVAVFARVSVLEMDRTGGLGTEDLDRRLPAFSMEDLMKACHIFEAARGYDSQMRLSSVG